jgi:ribosomal protein S14
MDFSDISSNDQSLANATADIVEAMEKSSKIQNECEKSGKKEGSISKIRD